MTYEGLPPASVRYLAALAANNHRDWFKAHTADYAAHWLAAEPDLVAAQSARCAAPDGNRQSLCPSGADPVPIRGDTMRLRWVAGHFGRLTRRETNPAIQGIPLKPFLFLAEFPTAGVAPTLFPYGPSPREVRTINLPLAGRSDGPSAHVPCGLCGRSETKGSTATPNACDVLRLLAGLDTRQIRQRLPALGLAL